MCVFPYLLHTVCMDPKVFLFLQHNPRKYESVLRKNKPGTRGQVLNGIQEHYADRSVSQE